MGRRRKGGHFKKAEEPDYDSDDPRAYGKEAVPDPASRDYIYDEVDEFHASKEKILLDREVAVEPADSSDNEEEVLGWDDDDDDDEEDDEEEAVLKQRLRDFRRQEKLEEMASDLEDEDEDDQDDDEGAIGSKAWGKRKQAFYDTDYVDDDLPGLDQADEAAQQEAEEQEALAIQSRMAEALQEEDFGLDVFKPPSKEQTEKASKQNVLEEEKVPKDLSKLSKREKLEILKKESPEFLELTADFKLKMKTLIEQLQPLVAMVKSGVIKQGSQGAQYIHTKYQLYLSYCMNISFYMILKSKHIPVTNHPVIGRILGFRKLISELQPVDEKLEEEMESLLRRREELENEIREENEREKRAPDEEEEKTARDKLVTRKEKRKRKVKEAAITDAGEREPKRKADGLPSLSEDELRALEYYRSIEALQRNRKAEVAKAGELENEEEDDDDDDESGKRGITYQISKNKGLTAYKRKELRNPRVKHRMKFRKAVIRRKGQVREARTEMHRYGGEASGIRAGVIKSVKIR